MESEFQRKDAENAEAQSRRASIKIFPVANGVIGSNGSGLSDVSGISPVTPHVAGVD